METILIGHYRKVWGMDWLWKSQVFQRTTQTQWKTSKMVFEAVRLQFYIKAYSKKNKY